MENHLTAHQNIVCIGCNKQIPKNSKSTHVCGEYSKCDLCDYEAKQKGNLQRHMRVHNKTSTDTKSFNCHFCPKPFNRKDNLKTHLETHSKVVVCETMETHVSTNKHLVIVAKLSIVCLPCQLARLGRQIKPH